MGHVRVCGGSGWVTARFYPATNLAPSRFGAAQSTLTQSASEEAPAGQGARKPQYGARHRFRDTDLGVWRRPDTPQGGQETAGFNPSKGPQVPIPPVDTLGPGILYFLEIREAFPKLQFLEKQPLKTLLIKSARRIKQ
jgi:hypothetical protein